MRSARLVSVADDPLDLAAARRLSDAHDRIQALWTELEPWLPDYVALRQGAVPAWEEFQAALVR